MDIWKTKTHANANTVKIFKSLGDENRFQIINLLLESDLCVGALSRILKISKPAVSQHLKILREAGLVRGEKIGYWTHYSVETELLRESARYLDRLSEGKTEHACNNIYLCLRKRNSKNDRERRALQMCKDCCEQPDKLKSTPEKCTPEQIEKCHGQGNEHCCEKTKEK